MAVNIPMVLISRELARKELKDVPDGDARATKLGFVAGFMGDGFLPAVVVQQIAKRDAADFAVPQAAVVPTVPTLPPPPTVPTLPTVPTVPTAPVPFGLVKLPDVVDQPLDTARKSLTDFRVSEFPTPDATVNPANLVVVEQAPSGPGLAIAGTEVLIAAAPKTVELPANLVGGTVKAVRAALVKLSADLAVQARRLSDNGAPEDAKDDDTVLEVFPVGGSSVPFDTTVYVLAKTAATTPPAHGGGVK